MCGNLLGLFEGVGGAGYPTEEALAGNLEESYNE